MADHRDVLSPDLFSHGSRSSTSCSDLLKLPNILLFVRESEGFIESHGIKLLLILAPPISGGLRPFVTRSVFHPDLLTKGLNPPLRSFLCTSQFQNCPSPRAIPGHLTRVKPRTVGNLTQNEAHPVGHLTFVSKRLSAVGSKRISQFFDS